MAADASLLAELLIDPPAAAPSLGGIPCLLPDGKRVLERWANRFHEFQEVSARNVRQIQDVLGRSDILESTRLRLEKTQDAVHDIKVRVSEILVAAGLRPIAGKEKTATTPANPSFGEAHLLEGYNHIMRDWCWGDTHVKENQHSLDQIRSVLGVGEKVGKMLVLGAGAARLAYDLHMAGKAEVTVAVDINPLAFLIAKRVLKGEKLVMQELPLNPGRVEDVAVERQLACPGPLPDNFFFVLADGRDPPFRPGVFDTVVTPWYIDQVAQQIPDVIDTVHDLVRPGGRWLNLGPLIYPFERPHEFRYTFAEVCTLVGLRGFSIERREITKLVYLQIPESTHARLEEVFAFSAKRDEGTKLSKVRVPPWLVKSDLAVPRFAGLENYRAPNPGVEFILSQIDGRRSMDQIAAALVKLTRGPAEGSVQVVRMAIAEVFKQIGGG